MELAAFLRVQARANRLANLRLHGVMAAHVLAHLFMHQTHHRGQAHTMPSSTAVAPPQLDEFLMPSAAPLRRAEMAAQGWQETLIYGP